MVNNTTLIGRSGKDPVIKKFPNDGIVAEFSLATTDKWKNKEGEWQEETQWHNIKATNKYVAARIEKYLKKGMQVYVQGKIKYRSWDDKENVKHYVTEILAEQVHILEKTEKKDTTGNEPQTSDPDDDLPF